MRRRYAFLRCALLLMPLLAMTGCWDRKEMDDLALVMGSGIDMTEDGQIEVSLQIALPMGMQGGVQVTAKKPKPVMVVSAKGGVLQEQLGQIQQQLSRQIFFGHRAVLVIGENYARHGIDQVLDSMLRFPDSRYNCFILTSRGTTAKEILSSLYPLEVIPAIGMKNMQNGEYSYRESIDKFLDSLAERGRMPATGAIRPVKNDEKSFAIDGEAVYRENKLVGYLTGLRSNAFRLLSGEGRGMRLSVRVEPAGPMSTGTVTADMYRTRKKIRMAVNRGVPSAEVAFHAYGRIISNDTTLDISKPENLALVERKLSAELQRMLSEMIAQTQKEFKADVIGFGSALHIQHPYAWKKLRSEWNDKYPEVPVKVNATMHLERIGRTQKPGHLPK